MAEGRVRAVDDVLEVVRRDFRLRDVERHYLEGKLFETQIPPFGFPVGREGRDVLRDEEATVRGQSFENDIFERKLDAQALISIASRYCR